MARAPSFSPFSRCATASSSRPASSPSTWGACAAFASSRTSLGQERATVGIVSQRDAEVDEPRFEDLYEVGTLARVVKVIRLGPQNYSVVLHGLARLRLAQPRAPRAVHARPGRAHPGGPRARRRARRARREPARVDARGARAQPNLPKETAGVLDNVRESGALADLIASNLTPSKPRRRQAAHPRDVRPEGARPRRPRAMVRSSSRCSA
jgi:ATP-dependent Lon protease